MPKKKTAATKQKKLPRIKPINNFALLMVLSVFQLLSGTAAAGGTGTFEVKVLLCTLALIVFLSGVGITVIGSIKPDDAFKQLLMLIAGVIGFIVLVFLMGDVDLCMRLRLPVAVAAILLLIVNIAIAKVTHGARNWITIFGVTFQPSEFVKVAFIFVGAATLEKIQTSKNLYAFIAFSLVCVGALIVIKDFGTALIFFVTFLIIAFMNSGDIKTIFLALASAAMGGFIVIKYKSYVTARFSVYRHVWEHYNDSGYQQTRVLVGLASGGLLGLGIGAGTTRGVWARTTDLIFGVICEEWGFLFGLLLVLSFVAIAVSALVNSIAARSTFYSIAAVAAAGLLLFQTALNIFGITDVLPLTGVTLPFVSQGGSSMISCWAVLAFIKASDVRTYNYLGGVRKK